ncbi:hypothetical protein DFR70_104376 [Nocardia tenerifensis]|uniref:Uncharacterized protein n=1 Tax=Nocardia tenerifensis TaxID=228006 RepID=A0A318KFH2_9NOCA|nr:hypothetical protein [Nocardia tenerifensis]PXX65313.1 hypothetical protein DFR70_104376 [Nocardia tenerifensis]
MATGVGLRIAEDECTAAIVTDGDEEPLFIVRESLLYMSDDGDATLGGPPPDENAHAITGFAGSVGDPAGISVDDGEAYRAEDLVATALFCLINLTADHLNGPAEFYATHPGDWPREYVQALRDALDYLGLRSVLLVSEADLPSVEADAPGSTYAYDAARAALAAVLSTPAGSTPPDPSHAENSTVDTVIIPAVPVSEPQPQAYSAAIPMAEPVVPVEEPATPEEPARKAEPAKIRRQLPLLIGAAALIGLVLGGFAVAVLFREDDPTPVPPMRDAKSDQVSVSPTPPPAPPVNFPTVPATPTTTEPPVIITTTQPPETTAPPPPPPPTTEPPTTTPSPTTRTRPTTTTPPFGTLPQIPSIPGLEIPGSR